MEAVRKFVEQLGHNKVIMKSDSEPSILALKEAVKREASVGIALWRRRRLEMKNAQGQFQVLRSH